MEGRKDGYGRIYHAESKAVVREAIPWHGAQWLLAYVAQLHLHGGRLRLSGKEDGRDGGSDTIRRRRP
jgi:hypothetical protein